MTAAPRVKNQRPRRYARRHVSKPRLDFAHRTRHGVGRSRGRRHGGFEAATVGGADPTGPPPLPAPRPLVRQPDEGNRGGARGPGASRVRSPGDQSKDGRRRAGSKPATPRRLDRPRHAFFVAGRIGPAPQGATIREPSSNHGASGGWADQRSHRDRPKQDHRAPHRFGAQGGPAREQRATENGSLRSPSTAAQAARRCRAICPTTRGEARDDARNGAVGPRHKAEQVVAAPGRGAPRMVGPLRGRRGPGRRPARHKRLTPRSAAAGVRRKLAGRRQPGATRSRGTRLQRSRPPAADRGHGARRRRPGRPDPGRGSVGATAR